MKVIIIEDEELAARRLQNLISEVQTDFDILGVFESIESSVKWLKANKAPDLIFLDVQLSDGLSFEIFKQVDIDCPVIFTTAFDEYAIKAFKVNSIDYLLKPIDKTELTNSIIKFKKLHDLEILSLRSNEVKSILNNINKNEQVYKSRFLVKSKQTFLKITTDEIAYFYLENKLTFLVQKTGKKYLLDYTLDDLEKELDPLRFYRANRQFILNADSIQQVRSFFSGKLKVNVVPKYDNEIIISRLKATAFKEWMNK